MRAEFTSVQSGFALLPTMSGNGLKVVRVNSGATALEAVAVTGTGSVVMSTSPTLVTPTLGVATATTINKVTLTAPATGSTLTIADGKTLTVNKTITLDGGDSATLSIAASKTFTASNTLTLSGTDGTSLNINAVATLNANSFTPTFSNGSNCTSSGSFGAQWLRVGNTVLVSGDFVISVTSTGATTFDLSLPVSSSLTGATGVCSGTAIAGSTPANISAGSGVASFGFTATATGSTSVRYIFSYIVN